MNMAHQLNSLYGLTKEGWQNCPPEERGALIARSLLLRKAPSNHRYNDVFSEATSCDFGIGGGMCRGWSMGSGPTVILVHGQNGRASQFVDLAGYLVSHGFRVVVYDAPGHGASEGSLTSLQALAEGIRGCVAVEGRPYAIVAHSMGAAGVILAKERGVSADNFVLLAPPISYQAYVESTFETLDLPEGDRKAARELLHRISGQPLASQHIDLESGPLDGRALIVHDHHDTIVPPENSATLAQAWPGSRRVTTQGLGHFDILNAPVVFKEISEFLKAGLPGPDNLFIGAIDGGLHLANPFEAQILESEEAAELVQAIRSALPKEPTLIQEYQNDERRWFHWSVPIAGGDLHGVTASRWNDRASIYLRPFPLVARLCEQMGYPLSEPGEVPKATEPASSPHLPFPLAPEVRFSSPLLLNPVIGLDEVTRVLSHASATYGQRTYGHSASAGSGRLMEWSSFGAIEPLESISLTQFLPTGCASDIKVFMRPAQGVARFRAQMKQRLPDVVEQDSRK